MCLCVYVCGWAGTGGPGKDHLTPSEALTPSPASTLVAMLLGLCNGVVPSRPGTPDAVVAEAFGRAGGAAHVPEAVSEAVSSAILAHFEAIVRWVGACSPGEGLTFAHIALMSSVTGAQEGRMCEIGLGTEGGRASGSMEDPPCACAITQEPCIPRHHRWCTC